MWQREIACLQILVWTGNFDYEEKYMPKMWIHRKYIPMFIVSLLIIFGLIVANFYALYYNAKENMISSRENEVLQAAAEANYFLIESVDAVKMASYTISRMQAKNASAEEILDYLTRESNIYTKTIDENFTGFYGVFNGVYLDGIGWVPEPGYVAEERPWYTAAKEAEGEVALVTPYLDSQTGSVMMSVSKLLADGKSAVSLDISLDGIQSLTEENAAHHIWKSALILDSNGFVVAHSDPGELGKEYLSEPGTLGNEIAQNLYTSDEDYYEVRYEGKSYLVFKAAIGEEWYALAVVNENKILGSLQTIYIEFFLTLILIFGVLAFAFWKIQQRHMYTENLNRQIRAMANIYAAVRLINLSEDTFTFITRNSGEDDVRVGDRQEHARNELRATMDVMTEARFKKSMFEFIRFDTLGERLKDKSTITKEYIDSNNCRCVARFVPVEWNEDKTLHVVMWMVEIIENRNAGTKFESHIDT